MCSAFSITFCEGLAFSLSLFLAPIALSSKSKIVYSDKIDDWDTEDLEYMTITKLDVKATITSELPPV